MKSRYRIFFLLLCLLLTCTHAGMAEEAELPAPGATDLPLIEAEMEEAPEPAETQVPFLPELTPPPAEAEEAGIEGVASGANYSRGYARLTGPATGYKSASPDAQAVTYLESGVLFVSERRASAGGDRLRVHFENGGKTVSVWVDARSLRPLSAGDVQSFVSAQLEDGPVRLYGGDPMLPLDRVACSSVVTYPAEKQPRQDVPAMFVNQTQLLMKAGESRPITVSFSDGEGHAVSFVSGDETVAAVAPDGQVTALSPGATRVQLRSEFSNLASVEILVVE